MKNIYEWHRIGDKLTSFFGICNCQRKLKSIVDALVVIHDKAKSGNHGYTGQEFLLCAMLEKMGYLTHGINCEYPIVLHCEFWDWILKVKDDENLEDN